MSFQDFLAHAESKVRTEFLGAELIPFSRTHVFNLGEDEKIESGIHEIWTDLKEDMKDRIPMPFPDMTCVSIVERNGPRGWIMDRIVEAPILKQDLDLMNGVLPPPNAKPEHFEALKRMRQKLMVVRVEEGSRDIVSWFIYWYGVIEGGMLLSTAPTRDLQDKLGGKISPVIRTFIENESQPVIKQVAAISHPANYILRVTPALSPREERRAAQGRERPIQKSPHFIVIDHDVLVSMSRREGTGHASPVPHERRGHWRRLADHCRHARMLGRDKVWVRPTYVGELEFSDGKNRYEVLMDFGKKEEVAVGREG